MDCSQFETPPDVYTIMSGDTCAGLVGVGREFDGLALSDLLVCRGSAQPVGDCNIDDLSIGDEIYACREDGFMCPTVSPTAAPLGCNNPDLPESRVVRSGDTCQRLTASDGVFPDLEFSDVTICKVLEWNSNPQTCADQVGLFQDDTLYSCVEDNFVCPVPNYPGLTFIDNDEGLLARDITIDPSSNGCTERQVFYEESFCRIPAVDCFGPAFEGTNAMDPSQLTTTCARQYYYYDPFNKFQREGSVFLDPDTAVIENCQTIFDLTKTLSFDVADAGNYPEDWPEEGLGVATDELAYLYACICQAGCIRPIPDPPRGNLWGLANWEIAVIVTFVVVGGWLAIQASIIYYRRVAATKEMQLKEEIDQLDREKSNARHY